MTEVTLPETVTMNVKDIKPYWRNPRRIPQEAVDAVAESIERFGYAQPIAVDTENVVIVGHTRLQAVQKLGWRKVPVYVLDLPEDKAKQYRLVDNRTAEMGDWDHDALVLELREFDTELLERFFSDVSLEIGQINDAVTDQNVADAQAKVTTVNEADPRSMHTTEVVCPSCFHTFSVRTKSLPGLTYADMDRLALDGEAE